MNVWTCMTAKYPRLFVIMLLPFIFSDPAVSFAKPADTNRYIDELPLISTDTRIMVLPLNDNKLLNEQDNGIVSDMIDKALIKAGFNVEYSSGIDDDKNSVIWKNYTILTSEGLIENAKTKSVFASLLQSFEMGAGIIVVPSVVKKSSNFSFGIASWDGTNAMLTSDSFLPLPEQVSNMTRPVFSVKLEAYDGNGDWLLDAYGGMAIPFLYSEKHKKLIKKNVLFTQPSEIETLQRGIDIAIKGLLPTHH